MNHICLICDLIFTSIEHLQVFMLKHTQNHDRLIKQIKKDYGRD